VNTRSRSEQAAAQNENSIEKPILSFLAMSDIHLDDLLFQTRLSNVEQFQMVLDVAREEKTELFVGGGDYSTYGNSYFWYKAREMVENAGITQSIWTIGNHEYDTSGFRVVNSLRFRLFSGEESLYYAREFQGCTFLMLGAESGLIGSSGIYSDAQIQWFVRELKKAAEKNKGKPIFVISHYDLGTILQKNTFTEEMRKYDHVFFLWGHIHNGSYSDMTYDQCFSAENGFTVARMGCTHYFNNDNADGLFVRVYRDRVVLRMIRVSGNSLERDSLTVPLKKIGV